MKKRSYETCDLMHGDVCVSEPCICKGISMSNKRKETKFNKLLPMSNVKEGDACFNWITCPNCDGFGKVPQESPSVETETQEQFAVRFAEWISNEGWYYWKNMDEWRNVGHHDRKTTSELIEIFKQQKS